ncbi:Uncharacterised protein [Vibrio cholerae]|nr:Uncharacterised protein [Vibrio cholerae]
MVNRAQQQIKRHAWVTLGKLSNKFRHQISAYSGDDDEMRSGVGFEWQIAYIKTVSAPAW